MSGLLSGAPNTSSDSSSSPTSSFFKFLTFITGIVMLRFVHHHSSPPVARPNDKGQITTDELLRFLNQHIRAVRAGQRAANHQQVVCGIDRDDAKVLERLALV